MKNDERLISKNVILVTVVMSSFLTPFMASSVNIALPAISKEFGMDAILVSWVTTSYLLSAAVFLIPFGRLADIFGKKKIFAYGVYISTIASLVAAVSNSAIALIFLRILQGLGSSMIFSTGVAILTQIFPPSERGRVLGFHTGAVYLGLSLGPFLGGVLTQNLGWRSIFWAMVPIGLAVIVALFWKVRRIEWTEARGEKFDLAGSVVYSVALIAVMYGFSRLPETSATWLIAGGVLGVMAFVWWEMKVASPVLNIKLFKENTVFALSNLAALINYSSTYAISFLLSLYLQYIKGLTPQIAGLILVSMPGVQTLFAPFMGHLSDRIQPRTLATIGMAINTIGLFLFIFLDNNTSLVFVIMALFVVGLGLAFFASPITNAIMGSVDKKFYGVASGTLGTMRLTGQMFSMGISTLTFALFIGRVQITPEHYPLFLQSLKVAFIVFTVLCVPGIFASYAKGKQ